MHLAAANNSGYDSAQGSGVGCNSLTSAYPGCFQWLITALIYIQSRKIRSGYLIIVKRRRKCR